MELVELNAMIDRIIAEQYPGGRLVERFHQDGLVICRIDWPGDEYELIEIAIAPDGSWD